jgi:membrane protease YdiL (CAAX protease family)
MKLGKATGGQVAFFIFAIFILTAPVSKYLGARLHLNPESFDVLARIAQLTFLAIAIFVVERINPGVIAGLLSPIPASRRTEAALAICAKVALPFAILGGIMLWHWTVGGSAAVERRFPTDVLHTIGESRSFSSHGILFLFAAVAMAPLIEEIAFRGLLYRAWAESWGWAPAMVASSALFGLFHTSFIAAFTSGLFYVCLYRRTGTLVAPLIAHAIGNGVAWYPLLGQFYFPDPSLPAGDLTTWWLHFTVLAFFIWMGPLYVFMSRKPYIQEAQ